MANTKITNPELFNLGANNTAATQLPVMTTTQRTAMTGLSIGEMIFNSTTDKVEYFDGTKWYGITYAFAYPTSLKMYLDASDTDSYPGTGTTWFDLTSNGNNGAINGASWNSTGYFNFNGSSDYVDFGVYPFGTGQNISYSFWIRPSNANADNDGTFLIYVPAANSHSPPYYSHCIALESSSGRLRLEYLTNNGSSILKLESGVSTLSLGSWNHYALTRENNIAKWYKNGVPTGALTNFGSITTAFNATTGITRVGSRVNTNHYEGFLSKLHVYDRGLTQAEVTALYNEGKGF